MEEQRNRAEGWTYAKTSGHANESKVAELLKNSSEAQNKILTVSKQFGKSIRDVQVGGIHETNVESVLGGTTKSKSDITVTLTDGTTIGISVKKSLSGQVYLITPKHFIEGYEAQYKAIIPNEVKEAIYLFWGYSDETSKIIETINSDYKDYEKRKRRLTASSLKNYCQSYHDKLLKWFNENKGNILDFCFSRGLAKNKSDHSTLLWYKNCLKKDGIDELYNIEELKDSLKGICEYGASRGGTTIQLPFGFVQWHSPKNKIPGCMQFHHKHLSITKNIKK